MTFTEIMILDVDCAHADESLRSRNDVRVSYILSNTPPEEWKDYFEEQAPASANAKIVGHKVRYECPKDKVAIQRDGACWKIVASLAEDANRYYLESELRREQDRQKKERQEEQQPREFEIEWDRYMGRD